MFKIPKLYATVKNFLNEFKTAKNRKNQRSTLESSKAISLIELGRFAEPSCGAFTLLWSALQSRGILICSAEYLSRFCWSAVLLLPVLRLHHPPAAPPRVRQSTL